MCDGLPAAGCRSACYRDEKVMLFSKLFTLGTHSALDNKVGCCTVVILIEIAGN